MSMQHRVCLTAIVTLCVAQIVPSYAAAQSANYTEFALNTVRQRSTASRYSVQAQVRGAVGRALSVGSFSQQNIAMSNQYTKNYFAGVAQNAGPARPTVKPFSGANNSPSVTPYLSLSSPFSSTATNYYTQVRPQIDQQRAIQQQQAQNARFQHQLNSMAARPPFETSGSSTLAPTGHAAVFQNTLGYYPQPANSRR
ncbi:MAG: hypothetical protein KF688_11605 [Pirellulales bacterium]|nr:hypothetical protein [Pirellulales bacterium]